jgi:protein involved in polysaccharide export with SLBB domain
MRRKFNILILNLMIILLLNFVVSAIANVDDLSSEKQFKNDKIIDSEKRQNGREIFQKSKVFGANLFTGAYSQASFSGFNPNYIISVGDIIIVRIWGAFNHEAKYVVDAQGNIFLPNIGPLKVLGISSGDLNKSIESAAKKVFENNVFIYANLDTAQPVKVFVTGGVYHPGLYAGLSSDSILSYLDKANGIDLERGSFVDIKVLRNNIVHAKFNLYDFLSEGRIKLIQLIDGDVIFVGARKNIVTVNGIVGNEAEFEFNEKVTVAYIIKLSQPKASATNFTLARKTGREKKAFHYRLDEALKIIVENGDEIMVTSEKGAESIIVRVEQPNSEYRFFAIPNGSNLTDLIAQINPSNKAQMDAIQIFRKSVAIRQKEAIDANLSKLESLAYTTSSPTKEGAAIRVEEAELISKFVEKARQVKPKGQIILGENYATADVILEDGDVIFIPSKTSLILVQGEVNFPMALVYKHKSKVKDYIQRVGGFTNIANKDKILIMKRSGIILDSKLVSSDIQPGDEILVLPKVDSQNMEVVKTITQILFQMAVSTKIVFGL